MITGIASLSGGSDESISSTTCTLLRINSKWFEIMLSLPTTIIGTPVLYWELAPSLGGGGTFALQGTCACMLWTFLRSNHRPLLEMAWRDRLFVHKTIPLELDDALQWMPQAWGTGQRLIHYVYNFLTVGKLVSPVPAEAHLLCEGMCESGKCEKVVGPTTLLNLLGIMLDTEAMELHRPGEKVNQLQVLLEEWSVKKSCCKSELLFFTGKHIPELIHRLFNDSQIS